MIALLRLKLKCLTASFDENSETNAEKPTNKTLEHFKCANEELSCTVHFI